MKRKRLHQTNHPFDPHTFEALWYDSWKPVERLRIGSGAISTHIVDKGEVIEEDVPVSHIRIRSRKATAFDCMYFLRPGIDVCVLSTLHNSKDSDDEGNAEPVWIDAKIRSVERKPHDPDCDCQFYISFYIDQDPDLTMETKRLSKETNMFKINQISVLQKPEQKPCETEFYRWRFSEDCFCVHKVKLCNGKFSADISWLIVASITKHTVFDVRSIQNRVVYEISENRTDSGEENNTRNLFYSVNFKFEKDVLTPVIVKFNSTTIKEEPEEFEAVSVPYGLTELRRSKRRNIQPERYLGCENLMDYEFQVTRLGQNKMHKSESRETFSDSDGSEDDTTFSLSVQADNAFQKHGFVTEPIAGKHYRKKKFGLSEHQQKRRSGSMDEQSDDMEQTMVPAGNNFLPNFKFPEENPKRIREMDSKYFYMNGSLCSGKKKKGLDYDFIEEIGSGSNGGKGSRRKHHKKHSHSDSLKKDSVYVRDGIYDVRSFRKGSVTAQICRELIRRCMENIDATLGNELKQKPVVDQWKEFQSTKCSADKEPEMKAMEDKEEEEMSEIDVLWKEMELALASWYLFDANEESQIRTDRGMQDSSKNTERTCEHDLRLNEQVGTVCQLCGFVETEIKDILPPFTTHAHGTPNKDQRPEEDLGHKNGGGDVDQLNIPTTSTTPTYKDENNVWALIPDLGNKLRPHQKKAFEFLWRNIAGSLVPSRMEKKEKKRGGCVISHTPGAGKTLLIIAFLVSYLKLFPGSRPLVLAPKTTLYTWYKEIIKWEVPIPVYQIHGSQTYKGEVWKNRMKLAPGLPRNQDVMHVLDCLEKMQRWLSHPSILLMGYTSFMALTREDSKYAHRKYMAQLLKRCPGILILDEGHNPRSTKSRLRKGLMKVDTRLRVLLSGTLFQNNFGEYFNTLYLARPCFSSEVLKELDPKYKRRSKEKQTQFSLEYRGRKLLIDKISRKIDSNKGEERAQALQTLKKLTSKFIDVYEGGNSDKLPGLQCYTLMMKPTTLQQEVLLKLQNQRPAYQGFPLELELLITLGAIHPSLIGTTACSKQYFSPDELVDLEQSKYNMKSGSKVRFVMNLVPRCILRKEKLLIFCRNIAPINLFIQIFEKFYGWHKGQEVLVLQGDMELFERGRVMDKFDEPGGQSKVLLASITACAEGISLTAASRVILLDSEWNPSKSKQAIARAFRPGQNKVVYVYQLLASGTLEEEKHSRVTWKEWVSDMIFSDEHVEDPSHWQAPKLEDELLREIVEEDRAALFHRIMKNEKASNVIRGKVMLKKM